MSSLRELTSARAARQLLEIAMHPVLLEALARERHAEMLRTAERYRLARQARQSRPRPELTRRNRLGWLLVAVGLRLVVRQGRPVHR